MKMWVIRTLLCGSLALVLTPALLGTTVEMRLTGVPYGSDGPYNALINGTQAVQVVCDNIDAVTDWATYTYRVTRLDSLVANETKFYTGLASEAAAYQQAAYLAGKLLDLNSSTLSTYALCNGLTQAACRSDIQDALWTLFDNTSVDPDITLTTRIQNWVDLAKVEAAAGLKYEYSILTPINPTTGAILGPRPQEFIMRTPEGSALALLAGNILGLAALVGIFRRRQTS